MTNKSSSHDIQLGDWQVIAAQNLLVSPQQQITLLPKVMLALEYFIAHPQQVITFDELNQAIWPDEVVGDNSIYNLIGQLRKALGDVASKPQYIETISKKGYRLIAPISVIAPQPNKTLSLPTSPENVSQSPQPKRSSLRWLAAVIALLGLSFAFYQPLSTAVKSAPTSQHQKTNHDALPEMAVQFIALAKHHQFKGDKENKLLAIEYYQKALALAQNQWSWQLELAYLNLALMRLIPNDHALFYRKAQRAAQAAQALAPESEKVAFLVLLLEQLSHKGGDLAALSTRFEQLNHNDNRPTTCEYLAMAQYQFDQGHIESAITLLNNAQKQCDNCAEVHLNLAYAYMVDMALDKAAAAFNRYHELSRYDEHNPVKLSSQGAINFSVLKTMYQWYQQTPKQWDKPFQLNHLTLLYLNVGLFDKAAALTAKRDLTAPSAYFTLYTLAAVAGAQKDFAKSFTYLQQRQQHYPHNLLFSQSLAIAYWMNGEPQKALTLLQQKVLKNTQEPANYNFLLATLLKACGDTEQATPLFLAEQQRLLSQTPKSLNDHMSLAMVYAQLGNKNHAITSLKAALDGGVVMDFNLNWWPLEDDPFLAPIHQTPEFKTLVAQYYAQLKSITQR